MRPRVDGHQLTAACARGLLVAASRPTPVETLGTQVSHTLERNGLVEIDDDDATVRITPKGLALVKSHTEQAETKPAESPAPRTRRTAPRKVDPLPSGPIDFAVLRERIMERYEADLAACDRMAEIAATLAKGEA